MELIMMKINLDKKFKPLLVCIAFVAAWMQSGLFAMDSKTENRINKIVNHVYGEGDSNQKQLVKNKTFNQENGLCLYDPNIDSTVRKVFKDYKKSVKEEFDQPWLSRSEWNKWFLLMQLLFQPAARSTFIELITEQEFKNIEYAFLNFINRQRKPLGLFKPGDEFATDMSSEPILK